MYERLTQSRSRNECYPLHIKRRFDWCSHDPDTRFQRFSYVRKTGEPLVNITLWPTRNRKTIN